jgi:hypothetical protein
MDAQERRVAYLIRNAFRGVSLGNGVGLRQACGLDDYADSKTLAAYRAQDEKLDWSAIPFNDLRQYSDSLSFFDAEGMRFHLPAFLIASLEGKGPNLIFHLTSTASHDDTRFKLLTTEQRQAVREFLLLRLLTMSEPQGGFEGPLIEDALAKHWIA